MARLRTWKGLSILVSVALVLALGAVAVPMAGTVGANTVMPDEVWVDDDAPPGWYDATHLHTIQEGVEAVAENGTVYVAAGNYTENVDVNKRLTLQGEGRDVVTVTANVTTDHVFNVTASNVNISGFKVRGATGGGKAGIYLDNVQHCNISANNAKGSAQNYGIYLKDSNDNTIYNNIITDNDVGICLNKSSHNTITDNIVSENSMSCPFVYSWDGQEYRFDSDIFPGSIVPALEGTDYDNLEYLTSADGKYLLKITEELSETGYVNELKLIAVEHPSGTQIIPDGQGNIHTLRAPYAPMACEEEDGTDCLDKVKEKDGIYWTSNLENKDFSEEEDLRDGIILTFEKPEGAKITKVAVNFKNSGLGSYIFINLFHLWGEKLDDWYDKLNSDPSELEKLQALRKELPLYLKVWNGTEWVSEGRFAPPGPWIARDGIKLVDVSGIEGGTIRIKLEGMTGGPLIDSVRMDYSADEPVTTHELSATTAVDVNGIDVAPEILSDDDDYLILEQGDYAYLSFDEIPANPGYDRSYVIKAKGYYQSSIPAEGEAQEELVEKLLTDPSYFAKYFLERWASRNGHSGIHLSESNHNTISGNEIIDNYGEEGIYLNYSDSNQIIDNDIHGNSNGIYLWSSSDNTIEGNMIKNNKGIGTGVNVTCGSDENEMHGNCFFDNEPHQAWDDFVGWSNHWDGNFWDPPPGEPGDPYLIPGAAGSRDNNPLRYCPLIPAKVPALTPIGIIALIGLLAVIAAMSIRRRKR